MSFGRLYAFNGSRTRDDPAGQAPPSLHESGPSLFRKAAESEKT